MNGGLVVDKPVGPTSHDVVARVRRRLGLSRVGHTGTLDPFASGVLPLLLGRATRLMRFLGGGPRHYRAVLRFGSETSTADPTGETSSAGLPLPDERRLLEQLPRFRGRLAQVPPAYSAKKLSGRRAYQLARRGEQVELSAVEVEIERLEVCRRLSESDWEFDLICSRGTYVRSLAVDLGRACGSGAHVRELRRLRCGGFGLEQACRLEQLEAAPPQLPPIPLEQLPLRLEHASLSAAAADRFCHGASVPAPATAGPGDNLAVLSPAGQLLGIGGVLAAPTGDGRLLQPKVVLWPAGSDPGGSSTGPSRGLETLV